jgi:hypothetical protein
MRALLLLAFLAACGGASTAKLDEARSSLGAGQFDAAIASAEAMIATAEHVNHKIQAHQVLVEARARKGDATGALAAIDAIYALNQGITPPSLYLATADQLKAAGNGAGAITLLDAGLKRHADDPSLKAAIEKAKSEADSQSMDMLKTLGYLGGEEGGGDAAPAPTPDAAPAPAPDAAPATP